MKLRILGLDLSLAATGLAATHDHHGRAGLLARTVHTAPPRPIHDRLHTVLVDVAAAAKCRPHLAVLEGPSYGSVGNAVDQLAGLRWIVKHWLWTKRIPYVEVAPPTLKVWAAGAGEADKPAVRAAVTAAYGHLVHIGDHNAADAVALLTMGLARYGQPLADLPTTHRRALDVPAWPDIPWDAPTPDADSTSAGRRGQEAGTR